MKKLVSLSILCFVFSNIFAQSGTMLPDGFIIPKSSTRLSCLLDDKGKVYFDTQSEQIMFCNGSTWKPIYDNTSTMLPETFVLPNANTAPTCATTDKGKVYFDTQSERAMFCNGSAWKPIFDNTSPMLPETFVIPNANTAPTCTTADKGKVYFDTQTELTMFCNGSTWKPIYDNTSTMLPETFVIPNATTAPTCAVTDKGKVYYNTQTDRMMYCNGSTWKPISDNSATPSVGVVTGLIGQIPFGGGSATFVFAGTTATVTVNGTQKIIATATGVFGHGNTNPQPVSFAVCYSDVPTGSPLSSFATVFPDATVAASPNKTSLTATGVIQRPAGTYKIGLCIKNKSSNVNLGANDYMNLVYQIVD